MPTFVLPETAPTSGSRKGWTSSRERAGLEDGVGVDHDDDVVPGLRDPGVQRGGLARVLLAQDARPGQVEALDEVARAVGRAVVDDEHLELGVVARVERAHRRARCSTASLKAGTMTETGGVKPSSRGRPRTVLT